MPLYQPAITLTGEVNHINHLFTEEYLMKNKKRWLVLIVVLLLAGAGYAFRGNLMQLMGGEVDAQTVAANTNRTGLAANTTTIRSAADSSLVSAAGNIAVIREQPVILLAEGIITELAVDTGDIVAAGDILLAVDSSDLEHAVKQAEFDLELAQLALDTLSVEPDAGEVVSAQANLVSAQESLREVQAGPSQAELAAAEASLAAAQNTYQELLAGPSEAELVQLKATLQKAEITLSQAQGAYDRIAYTDNVGASSQAATLQEATIDYESALAAYEEASAPATQSQLQDALSAIQTARNNLDILRNRPTAADLASADAQVASAAAAMESLLAGPTGAELREAQINVEQARLSLEEAQTDLAKAQLSAPIDGTILSVDVNLGQQVSSGANAVTMADLAQLKLTVNVAEVDISKLQLGQVAEITLDALPEQVFNGIVTQIAPSSASESGVVNYPVTIQLADADLTGVRPGMTAVATILDDDAAAGWLVPTSAIIERGGVTNVLIIRNGQPQPVQVTKIGAQGEWTIVESPELQAGDQAAGGVSSFVNEENTGGFRGGFGGPLPGGGR
jgi:HlyD family secretion protein